MNIEFNILGNASDSMERAIELIAWGDQQHDARRLKQAIQSVAHGIELLLKERLKRIHPSLIWENVDKYPSLNARTVSTDLAVSRLRSIGGVEFTIADVELLRSLRATRNAIEHHAWVTTKMEADAIVGRALEFAFFFARTELGHEYMDYSSLKDGTYRDLVESNPAFEAAERRRESGTFTPSAEVPDLCSVCRARSVDPVSRACRLCGHWERMQSRWPEGDDSPF
jgi:hypothetical protein